MLDAVLMPPGEDWYSVMVRDSRGVENRELVAGADRPDLTMRRAAIQQWNLAEYHYARGEYDQATREYQRLIDEFPYVELDYGFRTDDARKRLREITDLRRDSAAAARINPNAPLSGD